MRVTISHDRPKTEVMQAVDHSFNEMFRGIAGLPVQLTVDDRQWQGSVLIFALTAKWGLISTPIKGTVAVTDHDITVDADLGFLNRFVSEKAAAAVIGGRIKGLLK
jgi:hypothetical protein